MNGSLANDLNSRFGPSSSYPSYTQSELYWAFTASLGGTTQPKTSLYVHTADSGNLYNGKPIADWPTSSISTEKPKELEKGYSWLKTLAADQTLDIAMLKELAEGNF